MPGSFLPALRSEPSLRKKCRVPWLFQGAIPPPDEVLASARLEAHDAGYCRTTCSSRRSRPAGSSLRGLAEPTAPSSVPRTQATVNIRSLGTSPTRLLPCARVWQILVLHLSHRAPHTSCVWFGAAHASRQVMRAAPPVSRPTAPADSGMQRQCLRPRNAHPDQDVERGQIRYRHRVEDSPKGFTTGGRNWTKDCASGLTSNPIFSASRSNGDATGKMTSANSAVGFMNMSAWA